MTCSACAARIEKALLKVPGVLEANVNLALERADVTAIAGQADRATLAAAVQKAGYTAQFAGDSGTEDEARREAEARELRRELYTCSPRCY